MRYGSMCSGIEAATKAWHVLDWEPAFFSEIEAFPSAVLDFHYPDVPNHGDMTKFESWPDHAIDLLVAGTPCQSFSVAGLRKGLDDPRGNLMLVFGAVAQRYRPRWLAWENVPGVLSDDGGRSFASLLGLLAGRRVEVPANGWRNAGIVVGYKGAYGLAWRVLDAQYIRVDGFGRAVPQRRRRVFVVGYLGDWRRAAAVLLESESLRGDPAPRRQAGKGVAPTISARTKGGGGLGTDFDLDGGLITDEVSRCDTTGYSQRLDWETENFVAHVATTVLDDGLVPSVAGTMKSCAQSGGFSNSADHAAAGYMIPVVQCRDVAGAITSNYGKQVDNSDTALGPNIVAHTLRAEGFDASEDGTGRQNLVPIHFQGRGSNIDIGQEVAGTIGQNADRASGGAPCVAFAIQAGALRENPTSGPDGVGIQADIAYTLEARSEVQAAAYDLRGREGGAQFEGPHETANIRAASGGSSRSYVAQQWAVRRLTPTECERLQGFPDDFTNIPYRGKNGAADGPRYKALGNSMAVNCMRWLGQRIAEVDKL